MRALALSILLLGCNSTPTKVESSSAPLVTVKADAKVIDARDGRRILAGEAPRGPEQTDIRPARPMVLEEAGRFLEPPKPSWTGRLTANGVVWVTTGERLVDQNDKTLDEDVAPELAVSPDGHRIAYTKGFPNGVWILDLRDGRPRHATAAMHDANQPVFHGEHRLVVAGAKTDEFYGIWVVDLEGQSLRAITNGHLHVGQGLDGAFVPPPARHDSMRIEGDTLIYDDGTGERRVNVGPAR